MTDKAEAAATKTTEVKVVDGEDDAFALFEDVFRRADKNDDNSLDLEEFYAFFDDEAMTRKDLKDLFQMIDADSNETIDREELTSYFRNGFDDFVPIFGAVQRMHLTVGQLLAHSHSEYGKKDFFDQFKVRFFLRELCQQLNSLYGPIDRAVRILEYHTPRRSAPDEEPAYGTVPASEVPDGHSTALQRAPGAPVDALTAQVERLAQLVSKLSNSAIEITPPEEETVAKDEEANVIISREMHVNDEDTLKPFLTGMREYLKETRAENGLKHVYTLANESSPLTYFVYEVYDSESSLSEHHQTTHYKEHQKMLIDQLSGPVIVRSLPVPASWFPVEQ